MALLSLTWTATCCGTSGLVGGSAHIAGSVAASTHSPTASPAEIALWFTTFHRAELTVTAEKKEKQTAGAAISLSHQSIINNSLFSARAFGPWLPRGLNRNIPRRCCRGHGRASAAHPNPSPALCCARRASTPVPSAHSVSTARLSSSPEPRDATEPPLPAFPKERRTAFRG